MVARRGHRRGRPLLHKVLSVLGRHYSTATSSSKYVTGSYGYSVVVEYHKDPHTKPKEDIVVLPPRSIIARYRPLNFISRGDDIYFVPPRFYSWPSRKLYVLGAIVSKGDIKVENKLLRIKPRQVVAYLDKIVSLDVRARWHSLSSGLEELEMYAREMLEVTAYDVKQIKTGIAHLNYLHMLERIRVYNVNVKSKESVAIMYMLIGADESNRAKLASIILIKVGPYWGSRLTGVIVDRPAPYSTLRFVAIGFTQRELSGLFNDVLDIDNIIIDLSIVRERVRGLRERTKYGARLIEMLRNSGYMLRLSDLRDYKVVVRSGNNVYFAINGISVDRLDEAYEVSHILRAIDLTTILQTHTEMTRSKLRSLAKAQLSASGGIVIDYVDGIDAVLRLTSFMLTYRSGSVAPQLAYPHAYMDIVIRNSKALMFRPEDIDENTLTAIAFTISMRNSEFTDITPLRLALQKFFYPPGLQGAVPLPCISQYSEELQGYINFLDLGSLLAKKIVCTHAVSSKDKRKLGCDGVNSKYTRVANILELAGVLREGDLKKIRNKISDCRVKSFLRCSLIWSLAYSILKGLAQIQGEALLDSVIFACRKLGEGCDTNCEVLVIEAGEHGLGFIDAINENPNLLRRAAEIAKKIMDQCNPSDLVKRKQVVVSTLAKAHVEVQKLSRCFQEFLEELKNIGVNKPSLDIIRTAFHEYLTICSNSNYQHLCSEACVEVARAILSRESKASEFLRLILPEVYGAYVPSCWDGCPVCVHISQRVLATGLTNHEQALYVSKALARILLSAINTYNQGRGSRLC